MAILIVDDETSTRTALRELLQEIGHPTILEAKNGEEALKILDAAQSKFDLIIADWEMPYMDGLALVQKIAERPALDSIPFLLITSDLPKSKLNELKSKYARLDFYLLKPFRVSALEDALSRASEARLKIRSTLLVLGGQEPSHQKMVQAFEAALPLQKKSFWKNLSYLPRDLITSREIGAVLIGFSPGESDSSRREIAAAVGAFKKTSVGSTTPIAALSRDPEEIEYFRTLCQFFSDPVDAKNAALDLFEKLWNRASRNLEIEILVQESKSAIQLKDSKKAIDAARAILKLDPSNAETLILLGDLTHSAETYEKALAINPCLPRVHIKLLELLNSNDNTAGSERAAETAERFCPKNQDVLLAAANAWKKAGVNARARTLAEKILKLNPSNSLAQQLLSSLNA